MVLSLPHMLLAPVLEAALMAKRTVRMQRLRSDRGAVGVVRSCIRPYPALPNPTLTCL